MTEFIEAWDACKEAILAPTISLLGNQAARRTERVDSLWKDLPGGPLLLDPPEGSAKLANAFAKEARRQGRLFHKLEAPDGTQLMRSAYLRALEGERRRPLRKTLEDNGWQLRSNGDEGVLLHRVVRMREDATHAWRIRDNILAPQFLWALAQSYARLVLGDSFSPSATCYHPPFRSLETPPPVSEFPARGLPVRISGNGDQTRCEVTGSSGRSWTFDGGYHVYRRPDTAGGIETLLAGLQLCEVRPISAGEKAELSAVGLNLRAMLIPELRQRLAWLYHRHGIPGRQIVELLCPRCDAGADEGWKLVGSREDRRLVPVSFLVGKQSQQARALNVMQRNRNTARQSVDVALNGQGQAEDIQHLAEPLTEVLKGLFHEHDWVGELGGPFEPPLVAERLPGATVEDLRSVRDVFRSIQQASPELPELPGWVESLGGERLEGKRRRPGPKRRTVERMARLAAALGAPDPWGLVERSWGEGTGEQAGTSGLHPAERRHWWRIVEDWPAGPDDGLPAELIAALDDPKPRLALLLRLLRFDPDKLTSHDDIGKYVLRPLDGLGQEIWRVGLPTGLAHLVVDRAAAAWRCHEDFEMGRVLRARLLRALDRLPKDPATNKDEKPKKMSRLEKLIEHLGEEHPRRVTGFLAIHLIVRTAWLHLGDPAAAVAAVGRILTGDDPAAPEVVQGWRRTLRTSLATQDGGLVQSGRLLDRLFLLFTPVNRLDRILGAIDQNLLDEYDPVRLVAGLNAPTHLVFAEAAELACEGRPERRRKELRKEVLARLAEWPLQKWRSAIETRGRLPGFTALLTEARQRRLADFLVRASRALRPGFLFAPDRQGVLLAALDRERETDALLLVRSMVLGANGGVSHPVLAPLWTLVDREVLFDLITEALEDERMPGQRDAPEQSAVSKRTKIEPASRAEDMVWASRLRLLAHMREKRGGRAVDPSGLHAFDRRAGRPPQATPTGPMARACTIGPEAAADTSLDGWQPVVAPEPDGPSLLERGLTTGRRLMHAWRLPAGWLLGGAEPLELAGAWGTLDEGGLNPGDPMTLDLPWEPEEGQHHLVVVHLRDGKKSLQLPRSEEDWAWRLEHFRVGDQVRIPAVAEGPAGLHEYLVAVPPPDWPVDWQEPDEEKRWRPLQEAIRRGEVRAGLVPIVVDEDGS